MAENISTSLIGGLYRIAFEGMRDTVLARVLAAEAGMLLIAPAGDGSKAAWHPLTRILRLDIVSEEPASAAPRAPRPQADPSRSPEAARFIPSPVTVQRKRWV